MPNIMIVNPPAGVAGPYYPQAAGQQFLPPLPAGAPRQYQILGADDGNDGRGEWF